MPSKTLSHTRANSGSTASDGWLNYPFENPWTVPKGYKITTVSCTVTGIYSASGTFPVYSNINGNAIINISFDTPDNDIDDAIELVFTDSNQITTSSRSIGVTNYNYTKQNTGITIEQCSVSAAKYAGGTKNIKCSSGSTLTLTINYEKMATAPSAPTNLRLSSNNVAPNTGVTLSWDASSSNGNSSITYTIKKNGSAIGTTTSTSYTVTSPNSKSTDTYTVTASGDISSGSNTSSSISLTSTYTDPTGVTNVLINNKSIIYIGTTNKPTTTLSWSGASSGTNNPITGYKVYKNGSVYSSQLSSSTTSLNVSGSGYYTVEVIGTYSNSTPNHSSTNIKATINIISNPTTPTISSYSTKVGGDVTYNWSGTSASDYYSVSYNVSYTTNSSTKSYTNTNNTSIVFPVTTLITQGSSYTVKITTTLTAIDGGTKSASFTTNSITRIQSFNFTNIWKYYYDETITSTPSKMSNAWKNIRLTWNKASATSTSGSSFKYQMFYRIGTNGQWNSLYTANTNTTYLFDISGISNGSSIQMFVRASDEYDITVDSSILTVIKMSPPTLNTISIVSINYSKMSFNFNWNMNTSYAIDLRYSCELCYDGAYKTFINGANLGHSSAGGKAANSITFNLANGATSSTTSMLHKLYDKVINQRYAKPKGKLRIKVYYNNVSDCYSSSEIDFNYNFITSLSLNNLVINNQKTYYNPGDKYTYKTTAASWSDAAGTKKGAVLTYTVNGNNKNITLSSSTLSYTDTAPQSSDDITLTYTLTGTLSWADGYSISDTKTLSVNIARWADTDVVRIANVSLNNKQITGYLILPDRLCSSSKYNNLSKITYQILYEDGTIAVNSISLTDFTNKTKVFKFNTKQTTFNIYAKVIFTNTSNSTITKNSSLYLIRESGVPLAVRKNYIGINVPNDFTLDSPVALSIYASNEASDIPVVDIIGNNDNDKLIELYNGGTQTGGIYRRGDSNISIQGLTTEINLNLSLVSGTLEYTINDPRITTTTTQEIIPAPTITLDQIKIMNKAMFMGKSQQQGSCTIRALGTISESASIPIIVIIRG